MVQKIKNMTDEYDKQALDFLTKIHTQIEIKFLKWDYYFDDDKDKRDIYEVTLKRGTRAYTFKFGNSIFHSGRYIAYTKDGKVLINDKKKAALARVGRDDCKLNKDFKEPSAYDILACMQKYDVGSFKDFCADFGYNEDSIKAEKIYKAVIDEYNNLKMLFSDAELEEMGEIQ